MRKFVILLAALTLSGPAFAQMATKASPMNPARAGSVNSWTGFYGGVNVGGGWLGADDTVTATAPGVVGTEGTVSAHSQGVIGGGQLGYNWQTGSLVLGIETDIQWSGQRGSATVPGIVAACGAGCTISESDRLTWFGTTRGRLGETFGNWLVYATGGAAYGGLSSAGAVTLPAVGLVAPFSTSTTRAGWTVGGGVEAPLIGNWTWKVEYLYMDFGTASSASAVASPPAVAGSAIHQALHLTDNLVRGGVNLRF